MLSITVTGNGLVRFHDAVRALGEPKARVAYSRAINRVGKTVGNEAGRALSDQTGLPKSTGKRAVTRKVDRASPGSLTYTIHGRGGEISLRYFKPRETRKGVTASPWNKRTLFPSTFMKAGWWPTRVGKPNWNRQVFERLTTSGYGTERNAVTGKIERKGTKFKKVKSGVFIPHEMVRGQVAQAWTNGGRTRLQPRVEHEIAVLTKGVVTGARRGRA